MVASGYFLAVAVFGRLDIKLLSATLIGTGLVIASAGVFNNYIDRGIDKKMARTRRRALVIHQIGGPAALVYASVLGAAGLGSLAIFTNWTVVWLNLLAIFWYVVIYGIAKRKTVHGTLLGAVPGAIPPVAGYAAAAPLDKAALIFFLILVFWQMPHFYAVAMYRFGDYLKAGLPVMPVRFGQRVTRLYIMAYVTGLAVCLSALTIFGYAGLVFLAIGWILCAYWIKQGVSGWRLSDEKWGRRMFLASLLVLPSLAALIPLGALLK